MDAFERCLMRRFFNLLLETLTLEDLLGFEVSEKEQQRISELVEKNSQGRITNQDYGELQRFIKMEDIITKFKARALTQLGRVD